jgi:hypothetical protein
MGATYVLEGRVRTFLRPDASVARFVYAIVANVCIGVVGGAVVIRTLLNAESMPQLMTYGIAGPRRMLAMSVIAVVLGGLALAVQRLPNWHPMVLANAFAQVLVVSIAEVVVCWAVLGAGIRNALGPGVVSLGVAVTVAALAFGLYHLAHSPPFNTRSMVMLLSGVGVVTGIFFFLSRDLYSTIIFHNAFALRGVTHALADTGKMKAFERPQLPLIATAVVALLVLICTDIAVVRPALLSQ